MCNYCRFPVKNKAALEHWEQFVQKVNLLDVPWRATREHCICSNHFQQSDYIIPPSQNGVCRLKNYVIPSRFNNGHVQPAISTTHPDALLNRVELSHKRPLVATPINSDNTSPPEKIRKTTSIEEERDMLQKKLGQKIRNLQQQLCRTKQRAQTMGEVIKILKDKLLISSKEAESLQSTFEGTHLEFLYNFKENLKCQPSGRRYSDEIKEFALTLHFYSPKAYKYVRSIVPLPNPSLVKKWSASFKCAPGFIEDAFTSLSNEIAASNNSRDCCLVIDAMSIRKQTLWNPEEDKYSGFTDLGDTIPNRQSEKLASEALVFLLVGTRSHWKCPIGYFLVDKINAKDQATLVTQSLEKAAKAGLKVWSVTADGTAVNLHTFEILGCNFKGTYDEMQSSFIHPTTGEDVFAILDPCHMLKLARNALAQLGSFMDGEGNIIKWTTAKPASKGRVKLGQQAYNKSPSI